MAHYLHQGLGCKFGTFAPPTDRSAQVTPQRILTRPRIRCSRYGANGGLPLCVAAVLRRRPLSPASGSAAGVDASSGSPASGSRATHLYDLDREGAYSTSTTAAPPPPIVASGEGSDDVFLGDGWGVVAVGAPSSSPSPSLSSSPSSAATKPAAKRDKKSKKAIPAAAAAVVAAATASGSGSHRPVPTPFFDKSSEAGLTGLTLLQARLVEEGRLAHGPERKALAAAEAEARRKRQSKTARRKRDWVDPEDLDAGEGEAEELSLEHQNQQQYFELNLEADGSTEVVEFDGEGRVRARRAPGGAATAPAASRHRRHRGKDEDEDDPLAFLADMDDDDDDDDDNGPYDNEVVEEDGYGRRAASGAAAGPSRRGRGRGDLYGSDEYGDDDDDDDGDGRRQRQLGGGRPMPGEDPLADEDIEWGLDELRPAGRPSLMRELGVIKTTTKNKTPKRQLQEPQQQKRLQHVKQRGAQRNTQGAGMASGEPGAASPTAAAAAQPPSPSHDDEDDDEDDEDERVVSVAWGGSGGASGIDMKQQEALLSRLYKPHKVRELMAHQRAAEAELAALKRKTSGRHVLESKVHSRMRIIAGSAAGKQLASSKGATTRPMMEKVRQALFNMIQAQAGSGAGLPESSRWLDLFAGTGSVGLEALSRGCRECHFIELDPWVCRQVLSRNISTCGFQRRSVVHTMKAEDFLRKSIDLHRFAGGPFDFLSVCPPYLIVSYPELMDLLERSPLLHPHSIVFVEYPKQLSHQMPATLGSLVTVRDRKYGRTYIRVYGPAGGPADEGGDSEEATAEGARDGDREEDLLLL